MAIAVNIAWRGLTRNHGDKLFHRRVMKRHIKIISRYDKILGASNGELAAFALLIVSKLLSSPRRISTFSPALSCPMASGTAGQARGYSSHRHAHFSPPSLWRVTIGAAAVGDVLMISHKMSTALRKLRHHFGARPVMKLSRNRYKKLCLIYRPEAHHRRRYRACAGRNRENVSANRSWQSPRHNISDDMALREVRYRNLW